MNVDLALRDLLPVLYAAPVDPAKWHTFLNRLCHLTEIPSGYVVSSRPQSGNVCLAGGGAEFDPTPIELYNNQYGANDPFRAGFLARRKVGVIDGEELVRKNDLVKTDMWNEILSPYGLHHVTMLCGNCDASSIDTLSLWRNAQQGPLSSTSLELLEALTPHVQTALRLNSWLRAADFRTSLSETAFETLDIIIVLVDRRSRIQHMNLPATKRLPTLTGVAIQSGRLVAVDTADDSRLQSLIQRAATRSGIGASSRSGGTMVIRGPQTVSTEIHLSVIPTAEQTHIDISERCATIFIGEPRSAPHLRGDVLREAYKLTATEARLADCLLEGKELRDAAEALSITWSTARFHLKRIFAKTGTGRQAELIRLMLSLPGLH